MKKLSMGLAALVTIAPAPFAIDTILPEPVIAILIIVLLSWSIIEFYIGLSRPCHGIAPSHPFITLGRMLWPLFTIYAWLDFANHWTLLYLPLWIKVLLTSICFISLVMRIWAVMLLGKSFSYDVRRPEGGILVTTGPYRIIRHPAYLAVCILGSFPGLILGSIPGFVGMSATTVLTVIFRTDAEEEILEKVFGDLFIDYRRNTYRLFPFIY